jgi:hypothetical protein
VIGHNGRSEEYSKAIDLLTINNEHRLQRKVETLLIRADKDEIISTNLAKFQILTGLV